MKPTKRLLFTLGACAIGCWIAARPADVLTDLGLTQEQLKQQVLQSISQQSVSLYASSQTRALAQRMPISAQVAAVRALGNLVRSYAESPAFKQTYLDALKAEMTEQMPTSEPEQPAHQVPLTGDHRMVTIQELYGDMSVALLALMAKEQLKEAQASPNGRTAATPSTSALAGNDLKRLLSLHANDPNSFKQQYLTYLAQNMNPAVRVTVSRGNEGKSQELVDMRHELESEYKARADLKAVLNQQLSHFIDLTGSVDFTARLSKRGSKMVFVNPVYEGKNDDWKTLFRMGREPVMAARAFALQWQASLTAQK
jgi:hypothetical protein